jgi:hypothetical protein
VKKFFKNLWQSVAARNLANLVLSVVISTQLVAHGVDAQDAQNIGRAAGATITGG